jgi:hypothetical protein
MMCNSGNAPTPQPPAAQCRIKSITITYSSITIPTTTQFAYDENGLLSEMVRNSEGKSVITYRTGKPYLLQTFPISGGDWLTQHEATLYPNGTLRDITSQQLPRC